MPARFRGTGPESGVPERDRSARIGPGRRPRNEGARVSVYRWIGPDLEITLRAQPGARSTEVRGIHGEAIKIRIAERPIEGAATEALLRFLAEALRVPARRCQVARQAPSRHEPRARPAPARSILPQPASAAAPPARAPDRGSGWPPAPPAAPGPWATPAALPRRARVAAPPRGPGSALPVRSGRRCDERRRRSPLR